MKMRHWTKLEETARARPQSNPEVKTRRRCRAIGVGPFHQTGIAEKPLFSPNPRCQQSATGWSHQAAIGGIESRRRALSIPHSRKLQLARGLISQMRKHGLIYEAGLGTQLVPLRPAEPFKALIFSRERNHRPHQFRDSARAVYSK